jgi:hypothetical protein
MVADAKLTAEKISGGTNEFYGLGTSAHEQSDSVSITTPPVDDIF